MSYPIYALRVADLAKVFVKRTRFLPFFSASYETFVAVRTISFDVLQGEIVGLLGANGAGKTTTIQMLLGALRPTSGSIMYFDQDFYRHRSEILQQVTFASTYVKLPPRFTVFENLDLFAQLYGMGTIERRERIATMLNFFGMGHLQNRVISGLSAGELTRVMLAKAFLPRPRMVLLDEPTAALDPDAAHAVRAFIKEQQVQEGTAILLTSHNMDEVAEVCSRVLVLKQGSIIANNTPQELAATVSFAKVHLVVERDTISILTQYLQKSAITYTYHDTTFVLEVGERTIARVLKDLAQHDIKYSYIAIEQPTLEDYFLTITRT